MASRIRSALVLPVALLAILLHAPGCPAQLIDMSHAGAVNPPANTLHTGMMFTAIWVAMSHPGHATDFTQDENGNWVGSDGTQLSASSHMGSSAGGVSQAIITCIDGEHAILVGSTFDAPLVGRDPVLQGKPVTLVVPLAQCDLWINPAVLAELHSDATAHRVVAPVQWKAGNQTIDAIRVTLVQPGHYIDHVYSRTSGICVHAAESSTGAAPQLKYLAPGDTAAGDTRLSGFDLLGIRDVHTPWANEPMPAWTTQFKALHYQGERRGPGPLFGPPAQLVLDVTRIQSGNGWVSLATDGGVIVRGQRQFPTKSIFLSGTDQYDGFFAGPAALSRLTAGQILDTDPVTHVQITVTQADPNGVTITSASTTGENIFHTFDPQSGKLIAFGETNMTSKVTTSFRLVAEE